jgi:enamine deaminase RidA (YjgF/YER057c/UK114 family)
VSSGPTPAGYYNAAVVFGDQVFVAGMTPKIDDVLVASGRIGTTVSVSKGSELAGIAARRAIAAVEARCAGATDFVPLSLTVFVNSGPDFTDHSAVADGASRVIAKWADGLLPVRAAVGVTSLPGNAPVEVSLVVGIASRGVAG